MRLLRRAAPALLILIGMVMATAAILAVTKDWLVALELRVGLAERGQSSLEASLYGTQVKARSNHGRSCDGKLSSPRSWWLALPCS